MNKYFILILIFAMFLPFSSNAEGMLIYKPPKTGAPTTRIGAGTRGSISGMPHLEVLAPQQTALTSRSEPVLYWYLSEAKQQPIEFTLIKDGVDEPLLEKRLPAITKAGLQSIRLEDYGISFQPGQEYRWFIAIILDAEQRSGDIIASATIRYEPLKTSLSGAEQLAEAGYWYDLLQSLIESRSPRVNELLKQVDLQIPSL